jgi:hypothetical protein
MKQISDFKFQKYYFVSFQFDTWFLQQYCNQRIVSVTGIESRGNKATGWGTVLLTRYSKRDQALTN